MRVLYLPRVVVVPVNQYIFNQPITAPYLPNQPITIHFLLSSDWSIQISSPLIGQHPKENMRPRPGEHPVFTVIGQSKTAFAFPSTNHRQTETTVAKSTAPNKPTSTTSSTLLPALRPAPPALHPPPLTTGRGGSRGGGAVELPPRPCPVAAVTPAPSPPWPPARRRRIATLVYDSPADFTTTTSPY